MRIPAPSISESPSPPPPLLPPPTLKIHHTSTPSSPPYPPNLKKSTIHPPPNPRSPPPPPPRVKRRPHRGVMSVPLLFRRLFDRSTGFSNDSLAPWHSGRLGGFLFSRFLSEWFRNQPYSRLLVSKPTLELLELSKDDGWFRDSPWIC